MSDSIWDDIVEKIDILVLNAVEADDSDFSTIIKVHDDLMEIVELISETSYTLLSQIGQKAAEIAMKIILQESEDTEYDLNTVIETCSTLQCMAREIINDQDPLGIPIPDGLELDDKIEDEVADEKQEQEQELSNEESYINSAPDSKILFAIPTEEINPEHINVFLSDMMDLFEVAETSILELENEPNNEDSLENLLRVFHTIKGNASVLQIDSMVAVAHISESLLENITTLTPESANLLFNAIDCFKEMSLSLKSYLANEAFSEITNPHKLIEEFETFIEESKTEMKTVSDQKVKKIEKKPKEIENKVEKTRKMLKKDIMETLQQDFSPISQEERPELTIDDTYIPIVEKEKSNTPLNTLETITKVNLSDLDELIDTVSELLISYSLIENDENIAKITDIDTQKKVAFCSKLVKQLQKTTLKTRMMSIAPVFHRMRRLGRTLSQELGKDILIHTSGENTQLDRNIIDSIQEPFLHLMRNAIDHGIENIQDRVNNEKTSVANIFLRAYHNGANIFVEIEDDGAGINLKKIRKKAIELGLVSSAENVDVNWEEFIFDSGFSTKNELSEISGRGIGLNIVKQKIMSLRGKVNVKTIEGEGTKFTVILPLTLAMLDGTVVEIKNNRYIISSEEIREFVQILPKNIYPLIDGAEVIQHKGLSIPIVHVGKIIDPSDENLTYNEKVGIIFYQKQKPYCLLVDEVVTQQHVVVKSLNNKFSKIIGISGTSVLGDGSIAYILDLQNIMKMYLEILPTN